MSRIGNRVLTVPSSLNINIQDGTVIIKNSSEQLNVNFPSKLISVEQKDNNIYVKRLDDSSESNMFQGTVNANIANAIKGLTEGFVIELEVKGVGYRAKIEGNTLNLSLGFSHPVNLEIPKGLKVETPSQTEIKITGADKSVVGEFAAVIRKWRKPEPYKGKGILYKGEQIVRKVGKTADKKK